MTASAVSLRGISKRFGRAAALQGVDLEVAEGTTLAVLGANGAGKSTLLRLIAGLARPSAGQVRVAGHTATHREARRRIGYVGHATGLYPSLTARENLIFAARLYDVANPGERADAALDHEGLAQVSGRSVDGFSRGMAQRLAIARGLIHDPAVVLLDEPFTGLDRVSADRLEARLATLRQEARTVIWVTHDPERAARASTGAVVLAGGQIVQSAFGGPVEPETLEKALDAAGSAA